VETEEQRDILRRLECHETPDYLFSPPVPVDRLANLLLAKGSSAGA
jgi:EAL domain-containing protein (putative c-di-GMP-specific phosphodiesterase class I)